MAHNAGARTAGEVGNTSCYQRHRPEQTLLYGNDEPDILGSGII